MTTKDVLELDLQQLTLDQIKLLHDLKAKAVHEWAIREHQRLIAYYKARDLNE